MTPEQIEQHRKRFNDLFSGNYSFVFCPEKMGIQIFKRTENYKLVNSINCYHEDLERYFTAYKESLLEGYLMFADNLEVELPAPAQFYTAEIVYLDELIAKLESQGIKVKPCK